jgi:hypothetical protein
MIWKSTPWCLCNRLVITGCCVLILPVPCFCANIRFPISRVIWKKQNLKGK